MKSFPGDAARIGDPILVGSRITTRLLIFLNYLSIGGLQLCLHTAQLVI
jgi:hypothetical protein